MCTSASGTPASTATRWKPLRQPGTAERVPSGASTSQTNSPCARAARMRATMSGTRLPGLARFTGTPPIQRIQRPNSGGLNSESLPQKVTCRPSAHLASRPTGKSQFEVCG
jgi:hypothetical protein